MHQVWTEHLDDVVVVSVIGDLDVVSAEAFAKALHGVVSVRGRVVVDLHGCELIDSWGLHTLSLARETLGRDRPFGVVVNPRVLRVFELVGFDRLFDLYARREAAVEDGSESHGRDRAGGGGTCVPPQLGRAGRAGEIGRASVTLS